MISVKVTGQKEAVRSLINLQLGLNDLSPFTDWIGRYLSNTTVERFHTKKDPEGVRWAELARSTVERKGHDKILVDTGELMDSITYSSSPKGAFIFSDDANQDKVRTAQFGDRNVPQRAIFGLPNQDAEAIENQGMIWIEGLL